MKWQTDIVPGAEISPEEWDDFVQRSPQGSLYVLHGYATAIKPGWQAAIVKNETGWQAVMPFFVSRKWGIKAMLQPLFAQYWGILFAASAFDSNHRQIEWEKALIGHLLPVCDGMHLYTMNVSPALDYVHPFHWQGYRVNVRHTQVLSLTAPEDVLFAHFAGSLRRQIRKAEAQALQLHTGEKVEELIRLIELNHAGGNAILDTPTRDAATLRRIAAYLADTERGWLLSCRDAEGQVLAAGLWGIFRGRLLYLIGAYHPEYRDRGAMSWLMWQAIRQAKMKEIHSLDFEGSMIEGVEHFFRKFNSSYEVYFQIHKNQLPLLIRWIHAFA
jgi:hypothetical protein